MKVAVLCQERRHSLRHWPNSPFIPRRNFAPSFRSSDVRFGSEADILHRLADRYLNVAPRSPIVARVLSKSLVERASLSSLHITKQSPSANAAMAFASCGLSVRAPDCFSL